VVYQDAEGSIIAANPAAERILGLTADEMQGRTSHDPRWRSVREDGSIFPGNEHPAMVALRTGEAVHDVIMGVYHPRTGEHTWIRVTALPQFRPGEKSPYLVYTTFEDITEQRRVEFALRERVKELSCLYAVSILVERRSAPIGQILQDVADILPASWQFPDITCAWIEWAGHSFCTAGCVCGTSPWQMSSDVVVSGEVVGSVTVRYREKRPDAEEGPFLTEERSVLDAVARQLGSMLLHRTSQEEIERLAKFPSQNPNPVLHVSAQGTIIYHNDASVPLLQHWRCNQGGKLPDEWRQLAVEAIQDNEPKVTDVEYGSKTISLTFAPLAEADVVNIYGMDVSGRKKVERSLRESENRFRSIAEHAVDYIFIKDATRRYTFANAAMQTLLGMAEADILGKSPEDLYGPEQARVVKEVDDRTFAGEVVSRTERLVIGGDEKYFHTIQTPLATSGGKVTSIMGIVRDVTAQRVAARRERALMEQLARAERLESLGTLAGGIAHDFNNLLSPNVALPSILLEDLQDVTQEQCPNINSVREYITAIEQCSLRAAETIKDILVLSKTHILPRSPLDVNEVVTAFLKSTIFRELKWSSSGVVYQTDLTKEIASIRGTRSLLDRLLLNLTRNAAMAIERGGTVTIKTESVVIENPLPAYEVIEPGHYVVLSVTDTGSGITQDVLQRVFEPFFTTRKEPNRSGSGLGLSVVHGIVKNHGGAVDITTEVERGSTFSAYFPAAATSEARPDPNGETPPLGNEHVLVVDDEGSQRFAARHMLQRLGYRVSEAANGHEALHMFEEAARAEEGSPFDLVILDMVMELGFDGLATLRAIRELYPEQKAMVVSGYASDEIAAHDAGRLNARWLAKPFLRDELAREVRKQLDGET